MNDKVKMAVILLAHGTREPGASDPVRRYSEALALRSGFRVEPCFREFIEPSVRTLVARLVGEGVLHVVVVPFFLFRSAHVTRDLIDDFAEAGKRHPGLQVSVGDPVGFDEALVPLLERRLAEAMAKPVLRL